MENTTTSPYKSTSQALGIIGFVLGILTLLISFLPCVGVMAIVFGIVAIVLSTTALIISIQHHQSKLFATIGLILALLGCAIAGLQYFVLAKIAKNIPNQYQEELPYIIDRDTIFAEPDNDDAAYEYQDTLVPNNATK
ncbi:hypothetical protein [Flavobacterium sp. NKUCC04_CG]|uniref:hypothetical protein n=1 Tax=Flavobacterium sp. NKUCC04_CG TaxID=2842121 RepID=UPI001C5B3E86|nr:hypothetical protein [Flavobacterium sp. NKUCC04_CG]MBW3518448.1 hypothetical protein [Flavobacterium sp. NKUCC04_CG]